MTEQPDLQDKPIEVLVVDDEEALARVVGSYLERAGFSVRTAHTGPEAVSLVESLDFDVVMLDLGLPGLDGVEVCRQIRTHSDCYILMLTARSEEVDKLIGLSVGADDYMTKPFSPRELVARVQVLVRRPRATKLVLGERSAPSTFGALSVDPRARQVFLSGTEVDLTRTEFDVLAALAAEPRMALSRLQILQAVWGPTWVGDQHVVDVHVGHIRRKLNDDPAAPRYIETVRGVGYRMGKG